VADPDLVTIEGSALAIVTQRPSPANNFTTEVSLSSFSLRFALASTLLATALMVNCSSWTTQAPEGLKAANDRKAAPDFTLSDAKSAQVKLSDYKGKVVLVNFWATWCGPCKVEVPWFVEFEKKYQDRGFAVLGVSMDDGGLQVVRTFMEEHKVNYHVAIGTDQVARLYGGVDSLPTTFIIDRDGRIASAHIGLASKSNYENEILQLLDSDKHAVTSARNSPHGS
jgi:peroxiredoxin